MTVLAGYGPPNASGYGGDLAATIGPASPAPPPEPLTDRAAGFGEPNASTYGGSLPGIIGGANAAPESVSQLLDVEGFAMVVETHDGERARFASSVDGAGGLTSLQIESPVNKVATFQADLPALGGELFRWAMTDVVIGHNGERLFHGELKPVKTQSRSGVRVQGFGRLHELTLGGMEFSIANADGCQAINEFGRQVAERTDGRIRWYCTPPPTGQRHTIGEEGFEASGSPMEIAQELHGEFDYCFVLDPTDPAAVVASFRPGTQIRSASWQPIGDPQPEIDPTGYADHVIVKGAEKDDGSGERYEGEARASRQVVEQLSGDYGPPLEPKPNDDLKSDDACQSRARALLAEAQGKYSVTGSRDITPTQVVPGYVYEVPSFNSAVPPAARPVTSIPQKVTHTLLGDSVKTSLDFSEPSGIVAEIQRQRNPDLAPGGVQRQQPGLVGSIDDGDEEAASAYAATYPHTYPGPITGGYGHNYGDDYQ